MSNAANVLTARSVGDVWTAKYITYISIGGYRMLIVKSNFCVIGTLRSNLFSKQADLYQGRVTE